MRTGAARAPTASSLRRCSRATACTVRPGRGRQVACSPAILPRIPSARRPSSLAIPATTVGTTVSSPLALATTMDPGVVAEAADRRRRGDPGRRRTSRDKTIDGDRAAVAAAVDQVVVGAPLAPHGGCRHRGRLQARHRRRLEGAFDGEDAHAHLIRKRPTCHVVGAFGRAAGHLPPAGIHLPFEQRLDVRPERLRHEDDVGAGGIRLAVGTKRLERAMHLRRRPGQQLLELRRGQRVVLLRQNQERERSAAPAGFDGAAPHLVEVLDDRLAIRRHRFQQPPDRAEVVVDDVAKRPVAARPGIRKIDLRPIVRAAP